MCVCVCVYVCVCVCVYVWIRIIDRDYVPRNVVLSSISMLYLHYLN